MKVTRLGSTKDLNHEVMRLDLEIDGKEYTITEQFGELRVHVHARKLIVSPCCGNEIAIDCIDD